MGWRFNGLAPPQKGGETYARVQPDLNVNARSKESVGFRTSRGAAAVGSVAAKRVEEGWSLRN